MDISRFIREHKSQWTELEQLLLHLGKRKRSLQASQVNRFTELYKTASAHLATLQTHSPADETTVYLNHLVSQAHNTMYKDSLTSSAQMKEFFLHYFPSLIQVRSLFVGFAFVLFLLGGLLGFLSVWHDPLNLAFIMPGGMADNIDPSKTADPRGDLHSPLISTAIMTNNIRVAVLAFISGITLGIGTVYLMISNGLLVGALAAIYMQSGKSYVFWAYILPHGIIELTAIFIAGGAGLYMGYRFFVPGPYPRKLRFLESAKESAQLLIGTIPLFIIAGLIEGYITPSTLPLEIKYIIAGVTLLLLALYFVYGIRKRTSSRQLLTL